MTPPAPPPTVPPAPSVHQSDAFHRVGRALVACWPQWVIEPKVGDRTAVSSRQRNRLLDETGSDYRPLVDLLIDLGHTIRPSLQRLENTPLPASVWDTVRAPLVHQIVSARYLQPDVARWAVDVWARALGVSPVPVTREPIAAPQVRTTVVGPLAATTVTAGVVAAAASTTFSRAATRFGTLPPLPSPPKPARPNAPSWAGGPASFGVGAKVTPGARSALAKSGRLKPGGIRVQGPKYQPIERLAALVLVGLLVLISVSAWRALKNRADGSGAPSRSDSRQGATAGRPATNPTTPPVTSPTARSGAREVPVAAGEAFIAAAATPDAPVPDAPNRPFVSPMLAGVAGRYRVTQRIRSVDGSVSCESVARALGVGRQTEERVTHVPGQAHFRIDSRGVTGTLDREGNFTAGPLTGTTNNIPWQFRMRGRFVLNGFIGESETFTQAILRWGRTQSCVVSADLRATRLPN